MVEPKVAGSFVAGVVVTLIAVVLFGVMLQAKSTIYKNDEKVDYSFSLDAATSYIYVTLRNDAKIRIKVEYSISGWDRIPHRLVEEKIKQLIESYSSEYDDVDVFEKMVRFHLIDKIPMMTGSKRFILKKVFVVPLD